MCNYDLFIFEQKLASAIIAANMEVVVNKHAAQTTTSKLTQLPTSKKLFPDRIRPLSIGPFAASHIWHSTLTYA